MAIVWDTTNERMCVSSQEEADALMNERRACAATIEELPYYRTYPGRAIIQGIRTHAVKQKLVPPEDFIKFMKKTLINTFKDNPLLELVVEHLKAYL